MRVSLNLVKKYIDLPKDLTEEKIAYDLTLRTVEVESVENTKKKFDNIVVGKIVELKSHPNADSLKICIVDIGLEKPVQIVCGGINLYVGEYVVVSKPGAIVYWHGEGEPVVIKETKMRGEDSYGMICASSEVYLEDLFPTENEKNIVDLKGYDVSIGDNIADALSLGDVIIEIDNKSLTNRPDLWGHLGIARELSTIYDLPLIEPNNYQIDSKLPKYRVEIKDTSKCRRYIAVEIDGIENIKSPLWMQSILNNCGMRPINAIVDITNYVMLATGQPLHAFDKTHVEGNKIIIRNANKGEKLLLLDNNYINLDEDDLVICDTKEPMALAGIKGGKKDSILEDTTSIVLEIANFAAASIRKTDRKFQERTDASMRFEKELDTQRVDIGLSLALELIKEIFPKSKIVSIGEDYPVKTDNAIITLPKEFLDVRLGKVLENEVINKLLTSLGYEYKYNNDVYEIVVPTWRSTGDVSLKDDVMGDIARLLSFESFEAKPLPVKLDHAIKQNDKLLERHIVEYLANKCGFYEIFTYPWIDEKYIKATGLDIQKGVRLATPPSPEQATLKFSLIPGLTEAISKNLRYYDSFKLFELSQIYEKGEYHPSNEDETLPIHKKYLTGCIVGKDSKEDFLTIKGVIENMARNIHMEEIAFTQEEKPTWADKNAFLNITLNGEIIGSLGLLALKVMNECKIKRTNVAIFELNVDKLVPLTSRDNKFVHLEELPLIKKDLSLIMDKNITWNQIEKLISSKVKKVEFIDEYEGAQVPEGKKSITLHLEMVSDGVSMTTEEIIKKIDSILNTLDKVLNIKLREE